VILLDTHVLVWFAEGDPRLPTRVREILAEAFAETEVCASPVSFWEMAMLASKGRLELSRAVPAWVRKFCGESGIVMMALTPEIAVEAGGLPGGMQGDPADCMLVATARHHDVPLLTSDLRILDYGEAGHVGVIDARR
jgi:PIN domain nuclease of toxin-antitoxin system